MFSIERQLLFYRVSSNSELRSRILKSLNISIQAPSRRSPPTPSTSVVQSQATTSSPQPFKDHVTINISSGGAARIPKIPFSPPHTSVSSISASFLARAYIAGKLLQSSYSTTYLPTSTGPSPDSCHNLERTESDISSCTARKLVTTHE